MTKPIDAQKISIQGRRVLFDTNIWLMVNGYSNAVRKKSDTYSEAYSALLKNDNTVIINDYVIGEYCNRSCKIEYENHKQSSPAPDAFPHFKQYRKSQEFQSVMESVRDTCLNLIDDCEFLPVHGGQYKITDVLGRYCDGTLDFSDIIMADYCTSESLVLMTDDADYAGCGLEIITANRRLLSARS